MRAARVVDELRRSGVGPGVLVAVALAPPCRLGLATAGAAPAALEVADAAAVVAELERELRPRWVWWSGATAADLVHAGVRVATCWDLAAVARLLFGGWRDDPVRVWALLHDLPLDTLPSPGPPDLFSQARHDDETGGPVRGDGHLNPEWAAGGWRDPPTRLGAWAGVALRAAQRQQALLPGAGPRAAATARSESAAGLLCAELAADGLPVERTAAEAIIAGYVGTRPTSEAEAAAGRARRDADVLRHAPGPGVDLRSPAQVRTLLRRAGIEVPDTRAWRLERLRDTHPLVDALLAWRKAERVATTYGYAWLDRHLGGDGRLRGAWSGSDGAAGRMTASAGLHNMPADLRRAVVAEPGHVFVRADLGQVEPRVLAAVAGDPALAGAAAADDMYAPVARQLGVDRPTAKVAVLGAMYGQTTGHGAQALRRLEAAYPVAMGYLTDADRAGRSGRSLRTHGGRLIRVAPATRGGAAGPEARARAAAQGRYARNAMVQGAAAELFKVWAVTVRARVAPLGARIVLCLHDELLVHAPAGAAGPVAALVAACLHEAAGRWAPVTPVRFVADVTTVARWADAKG